MAHYGANEAVLPYILFARIFVSHFTSIWQRVQVTVNMTCDSGSQSIHCFRATLQLIIISFKSKWMSAPIFVMFSILCYHFARPLTLYSLNCPLMSLWLPWWSVTVTPFNQATGRQIAEGHGTTGTVGSLSSSLASLTLIVIRLGFVSKWKTRFAAYLFSL